MHAVADGQHRYLFHSIELGSTKHGYKIRINQDVFDKYYFKAIKKEVCVLSAALCKSYSGYKILPIHKLFVPCSSKPTVSVQLYRYPKF